METARDIVLIVFVIEALIVGLALLVAGIMASVAIIEITATLRRGLQRAAAVAEHWGTRVDDLAEDRILPPIVQVRRTQAAVEAFLERLQEDFLAARSGTSGPKQR